MNTSGWKFWLAGKAYEFQTPSAIPPGSRVPLASVCESVALACLTDDEHTMYVENGLFQFKGTIDANRIRDSLQVVSDRHDSLRMSFSLDEDGHVQGWITAPGVLDPRLEILTLGFGVDDVDLRSVLRDLDTRPLDVRQPPLLRTTLLYQKDDVVLMHIGMSHAVVDGTSAPQLLKELSAVYNGAALSPVRFQYSQFCGWQRNMMYNSHKVKSQMLFWEKKLQGAPPLLEISADMPRPPTFRHRGKEYGVAIDGEVVHQMRMVMKENRQSPWRLMIACYYWMLRTYSGQDDIVLTMPRTTRIPNMLETVGHFANFVALRLVMSEEWNLVETCRYIGTVMKEAVAHGDVPFSTVIEQCCQSRNTAYSPVSQASISLILEEWQYCPEMKGAVSSFGRAPTTNRCLNDIHLKVFMRHDSVEFSFLYNQDIFEESTIARMAKTFTSVCYMWFANDGDMYRDLDFFACGDGSSSDFSSCLGDVCPDVLQGPLVHQLFEQQAQKNPEGVCIIAGEESLTYQDVNRKANMLATYLVDTCAVGPEVLVGVMLDRSSNMAIAILAVLKAGGGYVPMDPNYPDERLAIYASESSSSIILTQRLHIERAERVAQGRSFVIVEDVVPGAERDDSHDVNRVDSRVTNESTCIVLFTSGSTGTPKGVQHAHRHLQDLILGTIKYHNLNEQDTILMTNTICFDVHLLQLFCPLLSGARLVLAKVNGQVDGEYIGSMIVDHKVTGLIFTVPFLASEYLKSSALKDQYPHMKHWGMGGDAVTLDVVQSMQDKFPNIKGPVNSYGPTEGNVVTQYRFPRGSIINPIGIPDDNMHCCIVDSSNRVVAKGVRGELLLSGPRMFKGYFGKKELTDEKCIPNPGFSLIQDSLPKDMHQYYKVAYKTGDLVRLRKDPNKVLVSKTKIRRILSVLEGIHIGYQSTKIPLTM